jgi:Rrf2 family protein
MKITSRFTVAVHTLLCIDTFHKDYKVTSEFIASSVNVNPVIIRRTLGQLKEAGLVDIARGTGGSVLLRSISDITLLDVYNAVDSIEGDLFNFHECPNPACPVGRNIHSVLDGHLTEAQSALEKSLKKVKLSELTADLSSLMKK